MSRFAIRANTPPWPRIVEELEREEDRRTDRRQLIGFEVASASETVLAGARVITGRGSERRSEGFVTSACESPTLGKTIGLALLERGFERNGEEIKLSDEGRQVSPRIVDACFCDPDGGRMRS